MLNTLWSWETLLHHNHQSVSACAALLSQKIKIWSQIFSAGVRFNGFSKPWPFTLWPHFDPFLFDVPLQLIYEAKRQDSDFQNKSWGSFQRSLQLQKQRSCRVWCKSCSKHPERITLSSIMQLCSLSFLSFLSLFSLLQTGSILWITARSSREHIVHSSSHNLDRLRSYTGKIHFNIYLHEYFFLQWGENHKTGVCEGGGWRGELGGDHQKGKLCTAGMKNHCVTPGEKYCCFA